MLRETVDPAPAAVVAPVATSAAKVRRYLLASVGIFFVLLGGVGVFVPGLPTTGPLLVASWCLAKSCPWLEQRLIRNRFFGPYLQYLDGTRPMSRRQRWIAIGTMWLFVSASSILLWRTGTGGVYLPAGVVLLGLIGTVAIWRFRRNRPQADGPR
jgi:uncharacterized protein